ncbi:3-hydroxyacyl-CoA dehydrogenase PaaC [Pseudomonas sp. NFXW11]|uniref:3-hydroxyacyl-CoA dehydrogenase PaaH n=1 Tax=Pseudomonas sp. NFXW11 TaxID=2819531 RepID=UPI003CEDF081
MDPLKCNAAVAVVGAGAMGAGIAQVVAQAGHPVRLLDQSPGAAARAVATIDQRLARQVAKGRLDEASRQAIHGRLQPVEHLHELRDSALVIEAIAENLAAKQQLFAELEALCTDDCILASNTSSLSITALAAGLRRPQRLLGLHFFNPAPLMALVEVVPGLASDPGIVQCLHQTLLDWGKQPVRARSTPGFIVNRVARPFYGESLRLLQEGAADCATLDALLREAGGFAMGTFELTDLIGQDINDRVTCSIYEAYYADPRFQPSLIQQELVAAGHLGRKSGQGFYSYAEGAQRPPIQQLHSNAKISDCVLEGDLAWAMPLVQRLEQRGIQVLRRDGPGLLRVGDAVLVPSDGRLASQRARDSGQGNLVLLDLAADYQQATRLAISCNAGIQPHALDQAVALLQQAGLQVSRLSDTPALAVLRTVAMLANEAADALLQGVASAADIDLAMRLGVNYPLGPLAWAERLGLGHLLQVLENLQGAYGEDRYRPSLLLRRRVAEGRNLHD